MVTYLSGTEVVFTQPMVNAQGVTIRPTACSVRVLDQDENELVAPAVIAVDESTDSVDVTISDANNTLAVGVTRGLRQLEFTISDVDGTYHVSARYLLKGEHLLVIGDNSFQTYNQALVRAASMTDLGTWESSSEEKRIKALEEAYRTIAPINYRYTRDNWQDYAYLSVDDVFSVLDLRELTKDEILQLPAEFLEALQFGQIAEANFVLGGSRIEDKRSIGLMSETIGESSNMFRTGKPLKLPMSEAAMRYLQGYINFTVRAGR